MIDMPVATQLVRQVKIIRFCLAQTRKKAYRHFLLERVNSSEHSLAR